MRARGRGAASKQQNRAETPPLQELGGQFTYCNELKNSPGCEAISHGGEGYDSGCRRCATSMERADMTDTRDLPRTASAVPMMKSRLETVSRVRELVSGHARLVGAVDSLSDDSDLFAAGLTSLATVNLMLAIEEAFDIEIPDALLNRRSFASISALSAVVEQLAEERGGA
jgi:acyl carrier protein